MSWRVFFRAHRAREGCSPKGLLLYFSRSVRELAVRGPFSHVREWPPWTPKRTRGEGPSTPNIAGLGLEELHALRSVGAVYMASP